MPIANHTADMDVGAIVIAISNALATAAADGLLLSDAGNRALLRDRLLSALSILRIEGDGVSSPPILIYPH